MWHWRIVETKPPVGSDCLPQQTEERTSKKNQIDRFVKAYDIAVDSINKNGVHHYAALLTKYYGIDAQTVSNLPKLKYSHAMEPRQRDLKVADINN